MRRQIPLVLIVAVLSATGCTLLPRQPKAAPLPQCIADPDQSAGPCPTPVYDAQQARLRRFQEAEKIYREVTALEDQMAIAGTADPTARYLELVAEPRVGQIRYARVQAQNEHLVVQGTTTITGVYPALAARLPGAQLALCAEVDWSGIHFSWPNGKKAIGRHWAGVYFFKEVDGTLRLFDGAMNPSETCRDSTGAPTPTSTPAASATPTPRR